MLPSQQSMARTQSRMNPTASIFDKPTVPGPMDDEQGEAGGLAECEARIKDLEQRVAALEGSEQGEGSEPEGSGY
jgi:hypothetical protein